MRQRCPAGAAHAVRLHYWFLPPINSLHRRLIPVWFEDYQNAFLEFQSQSIHNTLSGNFELQSSAYELAEHTQKFSTDHTQHMNEKPSSKTHSRWTSIRPHLSSSLLSADQGCQDANGAQTSPSLTTNYDSKSQLAEVQFGKFCGDYACANNSISSSFYSC